MTRAIEQTAVTLLTIKKKKCNKWILKKRKMWNSFMCFAIVQHSCYTKTNVWFLSLQSSAVVVVAEKWSGVEFKIR